MAFNPDKYLAEKSKGFDPDAYLKEKNGDRSSSKDKTEEPGYLESFARGGAQGASLGFADELTGAGEAGLDLLTGQGGDSSLMDLYRKHRDESRANYDAAAQANPMTSFAGNLAGGIAPGVLTSGLAPAVNTVKGAATLGAGIGAASGLGASNEESLGGMAKDTLSGAALGGITGGAIQGVANKFNPTALNSMANERIIKATGAPKAQMKNLIKNDKVDEVGESLFRNKVAPLFAKPDQIMENAEALKQQSGKGIGGILNSLDEGFSTAAPEVQGQYFDPSKVSETVNTQLLKPIQGEPILAGDENMVNKILETLGKRGNNPISFEEANKLKQVLKQAAYNSKGEVLNEQAHRAYGIINKAIEDSAQNVSSSQGADVLSKYKQLKTDYNAGIQAGNASLDKTAALMVNRDAGLTDYLAAGVGTAATGGNPLGGAALGAINKSLKTHGNTMLAHGAKTASEALETVNTRLFKIPTERLAAFGEQLMTSQNQIEQKLGNVLKQASERDSIGKNALLFSLMQNPAYRQTLTGMFNSDVTQE